METSSNTAMDCNASDLLTWISAVVVVLVGLGLVAKIFKKKIFASMCSKMAKGPLLKPEKKRLFQRLDSAAKEAGPKKLKVLEIGGGSGSNFEFVETSVDWTVTEPNLCFEPYFLDNCKDWKDQHSIGKLVEAYGEDLGQFESDSFDAVVVTLVLCTVSSVEDTLQEIRRVLKPGGVFYFLEHVCAPQDWPKLRKFHDLATNSGIWPALNDGCLLNRELKKEIEGAGFSGVEFVSCKFEMKPWFLAYVSPVKFCLYGWATK